MTDASRASKRPRLASNEPDEKPFKEHPTLYFDDGNAIITAGKTLFRIHVSVLSKHSSVFRELFQETRHRFRGQLHLTVEDSGEDMEALLNVVYGGM